MQYRKFGNLGFEISTFGFGTMRLPLQKDTSDAARIDEAEAIAMIRAAVDSGVNYVDTAYPYHGGNSERLVAKALRDGYRDKVKLATKLPTWLVKTPADFDRLLDEQLGKLATDHIDFYLLHALDEERWDNLQKNGVFDFIARAKKSGKVRRIGFSFHDRLPVFRKIIDAYPWDMCQIQFNFLDIDYQAGEAGLRYAASRGIPVVVMEPLRGGNLVKNIPDEVRQAWDAAPVRHTPAEWAFRWVCNHPEVKVVLSGVSTMEQTMDTARILSGAFPDSMTPEELATVDRVREIYRRRIRVGCTGCRYCMPCPKGVDIPDVFQAYNNASLFDLPAETRRRQYANLERDQSDVSRCVRCGACEAKCPQHILIREKLREAERALK